MKELLQKINPELAVIDGCIDVNSGKEQIAAEFKLIKSRFPQYNPTLLWLLACHVHDYSIKIQKYIEVNYKKFHQYLDAGFLKKLTAADGFVSHMWEMVLCDMLSTHGSLIPKSKDGADFLLKDKSGQVIQIEAIAPNESDDENHRSIKPDYSTGNLFSLSGKIADLENPILLRVIKAFDDKAHKEYDASKPLIIAINASKVIGLVSQDDYVIRRTLLGLGNVTLTKNPDGSYRQGFENVNELSKPGQTGFPVARFRSPEYKHISGVIYTSQKPQGLIPGGVGWSNYGVTYVPNPLATHKIDFDSGIFRKIICNEEIYQEIEAQKPFVSNC